jgi:hypothetical protein
MQAGVGGINIADALNFDLIQTLTLDARHISSYTKILQSCWYKRVKDFLQSWNARRVLIAQVAEIPLQERSRIRIQDGDK